MSKQPDPILDPSALAALYAAGIITSEECADFKARLSAGDETCIAELKSLKMVAQSLASDTLQATPDPSIKQALMAKIAGDQDPVQFTRLVSNSDISMLQKTEAPWQETHVEGFMEGLRRGDATAFETLIRRYGGMMLMVAKKILTNEEEARNAVQEALLSAFRSIKGFKEKATLSAWLYRLSVNAALTKLRRRKQKPERNMSNFLPAFWEDGHRQIPKIEWRDPDVLPTKKQGIRNIVLNALTELPEMYREVLLLRDIEGVDTRASAQLLNIDINAVKTRLHQARQALRSLLVPHLGEAA